MMNAATVMQVKLCVARATEAVSSYCEPDSDSLPDLQTLPELLSELASGQEHRCGECQALLVQAAQSRICIACGAFQPAAQRKPAPFSFQSSLALQLFFQSLNLDPHGYGVQGAVQSKGQEGIRKYEESYGQLKKASPENYDRSVAPPILSATSNVNFFSEVEEEDIWESAEGDHVSSVVWTQELAEEASYSHDSFSTEKSTNHNSTFVSADQTFGRNTSESFEDFFQAAPQTQHNLDFFETSAHYKEGLSFPSNDDSLFALGGQSRIAGATPQVVGQAFQAESGNRNRDFSNRVLDHQGSSNDFFGQLEGLTLSRSQSLQDRDREPVAAVKTILNELPDLSFMLADHLVVPGGKPPTSMWSFKELE